MFAFATFGEDAFSDATECTATALSALDLFGYMVIITVWAGLWLLKSVVMLVRHRSSTSPRDEITQRIRAVSVVIGVAIALPLTTALPHWRHQCSAGAYMLVTVSVWVATVWLSVIRIIIFFVVVCLRRENTQNDILNA